VYNSALLVHWVQLDAGGCLLVLVLGGLLRNPGLPLQDRASCKVNASSTI